MKRVVWQNKSNGQLCVTIPKDSGLVSGEFVDIVKAPIKRVVYSFVVGDLFHYGHLQSLEFARSLGEYHICGVPTDEAVEEYRAKPIANFQERRAVIANLRCVDRVVTQFTRDCTENLRKIHEEFPDAEIILVHGDNWKEVLGAEYVLSIGGRLEKHPYYHRLSTFKILTELQERQGTFKDITNFASVIQGKEEVSFDQGNKVIISSKADTLKALQPLLKKAMIEPIFSFTISDWKHRKKEILTEIKNIFLSGNIVVRSSAVVEDTIDTSMAGCFESVLNVPGNDESEIEKSILLVIKSYKSKQAESSFNQVLVQRQATNVIMSGVVFTRTLQYNAPYYVLNYDDYTGSTDSVTAGREGKTMVVLRGTHNVPDKMKKVIEAVQEIETIIPQIPLDIEFAVVGDSGDSGEVFNDGNVGGKVVIFQVRPLAANVKKEVYDKEVYLQIEALQEKFKKLSVKPEHLEGVSTCFGDMPDWNPAEIIGHVPQRLDYSLYDYIITHSAWHEARTSQLYYNVNPAKLVELFGNKPYVNVRNTFNSFTPAHISRGLREKLVHFYLEKLHRLPHLQDKVEFEILFTCFDLSFDERVQELYNIGFEENEIKELRQALLHLTNTLVQNAAKDINLNLNEVFSLKELRCDILKRATEENLTVQQLIRYSRVLLDQCRLKGTVQFSRMARLAFIAKIILKSLVQRGVLSQQFYDDLYGSLNTVASQMNVDFKRLLRQEISKKEFIQKYYHLRPGTYDITSPRYDTHPDLINGVKMEVSEQEIKLLSISPEIYFVINAEFKKQGLLFTAEDFLQFVKEATEARELAKFEFTKNLSDAMELLALAGENMGFSRQEISYLEVSEVFQTELLNSVEKIVAFWKNIISVREKEKEFQKMLVLPPLLFSVDDFEVIEYYAAKPNFITSKVVQAPIVHLFDLTLQAVPSLEGSVVVLENGDPGYDWIFTRNIAGLITKYGGVASHMSIRCAEFGIPAAIGCGEQIFNSVKTAREVFMNCKLQAIKPIR